MRLKTIKLSGFKSFVDPTTFHLPSNLIGVVGPNGCGKSNIIDAVRWVMGESSARLLRGESMADVIFNGSNTRKPVSTATVELVFDNSDGSLGGEYASYAEISIKRQVSREGQSSYFLNGQRCRRRDITDIFLGTGLGPRSYSIIEQGMISQIVEARPEDVRLHLEEAAGISKYKERRRETENRIRHTRENLDRLADLRTEVDKQLQHLKRQARQAERYKELKGQHRRQEAELLALEWQHLKGELEARSDNLEKLETALQSELAEQRALEAKIEADRQAQAEASDAAGEIQAELYEVGGDIARIEQAIQHRKDLRSSQEREHREADQNWMELQEHLALDRVQIEEHRNRIAELEPGLEKARALENQTAEAVRESEEQVQAWQEEWDAFSRQSSEKNQQAEVERTRIDHLDRQLSDRARRLNDLDREQETTDVSELERELKSIEASVQSQEGKVKSLEQEIGAVRESLAKAGEANRDRRSRLDALRQDDQQHQGRLSSLEALQQAALGTDRPELDRWLAAQGLDDAERLAQKLDVEPGWETAVETVLGDFIEAVVCDSPAAHAEALAALEPGGLVLIDGTAGDSSASPEFLSSKVRGPAMAHEVLLGVQVVEDLAGALERVATLSEGESVITRRGEWLGRGWLRVPRGDDAAAGVIAREREIQTLSEELAELGRQVEAAAAELAEGEGQVAELEARRESLQTDLNLALRRMAELRGQAQSKQARIEHLSSRHQRLKQESESLREQIASDEGSVREARARLQDSMDQMADLKTRREDLESRRRTLLETRETARNAAREAREEAHRLALDLESRRSALRSTEQSVERMTAQMNLLDQRRQQLLQQIEASGSPMEEDEQRLKALLDQRLAVDQRLTAARQALDRINHGLREQEQMRGQIADRIQQRRDALEQARIDLQGRKVKAESVEERIVQVDFSVQQLLEEMPEGAEPDAWRESLERLQTRIVRLEPVNLAAIQEYEELSERKAYLDAQNEDLIQALETLEAAIRKIDRQTRTRFKETFDRVNIGVQELFPRLFGGGHGYLELVGDDLLAAGVQIMARPPGKRVTNIHLLSGGEKALTAVAFVFAIFRLNPAPFCLLDEVDAPLDDANVGRFSDMVREMAEKVQFLFVTHNKITMELAHQLSGVTMREPGVSRMVSVDVAEAERMASG